MVNGVHVHSAEINLLSKYTNMQGADKDNGNTKKLRHRICVGYIERT
jgi:hypothetical protein